MILDFFLSQDNDLLRQQTRENNILVLEFYRRYLKLVYSIYFHIFEEKD